MGENFHILRVPPTELKVRSVERATPGRSGGDVPIQTGSRGDARRLSHLRGGDTIVGHVLSAEGENVVVRLPTATVRAAFTEGRLQPGDRVLFRIMGDENQLRLAIIGIIKEKNDELQTERIRAAFALSGETAPDILLETLAEKGIILRNDIHWWKEAAQKVEQPLASLLATPDTIEAMRLLRYLAGVPLSPASLELAKVYTDDLGALRSFTPLLPLWQNLPSTLREHILQKWGLPSLDEQPFGAGASFAELFPLLEQSLLIASPGIAQKAGIASTLQMIRGRLVAESILNMSAYLAGMEMRRTLLLHIPSPPARYPIVPITLAWRKEERSHSSVVHFNLLITEPSVAKHIRLEGSYLADTLRGTFSTSHNDLEEAVRSLLPELSRLVKNSLPSAMLTIGSYKEHRHIAPPAGGSGLSRIA